MANKLNSDQIAARQAARQQRVGDALKHFNDLPDDAPAVSVQVYARLRGCSVPTIWRAAREGTLPQPVRVGPKITRWRVGDVRANLAALCQSTGANPQTQRAQDALAAKRRVAA